MCFYKIFYFGDRAQSSLGPPRTRGYRPQSSLVPQLSHQEPTFTPVTKPRGSKGPQKSVANYVTAYNPFKQFNYILLSHDNTTDIPQIFHCLPRCYHRCFTVITQFFYRDYLLKTIGFTIYIMIWNAYYRLKVNERLRLALQKRLQTINLPK